MSSSAPARCATGNVASPSRIAARATATASMRSDLPGSRVLSRAPAISLGGTRTTRSPRASKNRSSDPETCRQSSSAQTRSPPTPRAQRNSSPNERGAAATVTSARARPVASSTAASVCERLWVSAPITIISTVPCWDHSTDPRWTHLSRGDATLLSSHARDPRTAAGDTTKEGQTQGRQHGKGSARRRPRTLPATSDTTARRTQALTDMESACSKNYAGGPGSGRAAGLHDSREPRKSGAHAFQIGASADPHGPAGLGDLARAGAAEDHQRVLAALHPAQDLERPGLAGRVVDATALEVDTNDSCLRLRLRAGAPGPGHEQRVAEDLRDADIAADRLAGRALRARRARGAGHSLAALGSLDALQTRHALNALNALRAHVALVALRPRRGRHGGPVEWDRPRLGLR